MEEGAWESRIYGSTLHFGPEFRCAGMTAQMMPPGSVVRGEEYKQVVGEGRYWGPAE